jgi:hypothetical protein
MYQASLMALRRQSHSGTRPLKAGSLYIIIHLLEILKAGQSDARFCSLTNDVTNNMEQNPPPPRPSRSPSRNYELFMKPEGSLACPQEPASSVQSTPSHPHVFKIYFNIILSSTPRSPKQFLPNKILNVFQICMARPHNPSRFP